MISIQNQLEAAFLGQDVTLECHTEAFPLSINYWTTETGDLIISEASRIGDKYETMTEDRGYSKSMKLKIKNISHKDFGSYKCIVKNSLGESDGVIKLDEILSPKSVKTLELTRGNLLGIYMEDMENDGKIDDFL